MVDYKVSITTKLKPPQKGLIVIEPEDYTSAEVKALRDSGAKVLAYLSIGSISDEREYYGAYKKYALKRLENWPHERYLDLRIPKAREWCVNRALMLRRMGFDGLWLDNVDI